MIFELAIFLHIHIPEHLTKVTAHVQGRTTVFTLLEGHLHVTNLNALAIDFNALRPILEHLSYLLANLITKTNWQRRKQYDKRVIRDDLKKKLSSHLNYIVGGVVIVGTDKSRVGSDFFA